MATLSTPPASTLPKPTSHKQPSFERFNNSKALRTASKSTPPSDISLTHDERDDEASSDATNEPLTPTDMHHTTTFACKLEDPSTTPQPSDSVNGQHPLIVNTAATPPDAAGRELGESTSPTKPPIAKRPGATKEGKLIRAVSTIFKRSSSYHAALTPSSDVNSLRESGSDPKHSRRSSFKRMSVTTSPNSTRSNTPPSPRSATNVTREETHVTVQEPSEEQLFNKKKNRASTGLSLRDRFHRKTGLGHHGKEPEPLQPRHRATSVDMDTLSSDHAADDGEVQKLQRQFWGMPAESGLGLKSRRLSLSLPEDFQVDVVELYSEYQDQSRMVGKRGKQVGTGATASVKLMLKKGGSAGEVYAVKEFRGKSSNETAEEYEKKVKSEFAIANSLHHPNIVETFRLCTHSGRWNQVMEFCDQGDLFSLVQQKYLSRDDHASDRLCLFKQLIAGLNYLHNNGIAHRDVKLENLLITKDSRLKITDFGVSEVFSGIHPGLREAGGHCGKKMGEIRLCAPSMCGSPPYVAPEVLEKKEKYDPRAVDVWGAAIVMINLCAGGSLWAEARPGSSPLYDDLVRGWEKWNAKHADTDKIADGDYPFVKFFDNHIRPPPLRRMLLNMLNPDPKRRIEMRDVYRSRWVRNVECCQVEGCVEPARKSAKGGEAPRPCKIKDFVRIVQHNHLPPEKHLAHRLVRMPGSTDM